MGFLRRGVAIAFFGLFISAFLLSAALMAGGPEDESLRVMSFNVRCIHYADGADMWFFRSEEVGDYVLRHDPDVVGFQEVKALQLQDLKQMLPDYESFGKPRGDGRLFGERCSVFYKKKRFELLRHETFWLSKTPAEEGSISWDSSLPRIVTWGEFRDRHSGKTFFIFNTHFDHIGKTARLKSAELLSKKVDEIAGHGPVVVTGDFNSTPDSRPYRVMIENFRDGRKVSKSGPEGPYATSRSFLPGSAPKKRIDYIFVGGGVDVLSYAVLDDTYGNDRRPSDHMGVLASISIR